MYITGRKTNGGLSKSTYIYHIYIYAGSYMCI